MPARLTDHAARLRTDLQHALTDALVAPVWGHPEAMTQALKEVRKSFDSAAAEAPAKSIAQSVWTFRNSKRIGTFRDLKYVCYGLALKQGADETTLLGDEDLYPALIAEVHDLASEPRRFRKCYQGLLSSYLNFPADEDASPQEVKHWQQLRAYLLKQLGIILSVEPVASWVKVLESHANLLREKPCKRYADALRKGQWDELEQVAAGLAISSQSWVWKQAVLAHVEAVAEIHADETFRNELDMALHALEGKRFPLGDEIRRKGAASLLCRYTRCSQRPEHGELLDLALRCFGKPWLHRTAWDAYVGNDDARRLIDSWLKTGLIQDFFQLLAADGVADRSRMRFWPHFVPVIDDIWFALGSFARESKDPNYVRLKNRIGRERIVDFVGAGFTNNAFIMRIGPYYLVEFGQKGRAAYMIHADNWKADLSPKASLSLEAWRLQNMGGKQLTHMPTDSWEHKFRQELCPKIGWWPGQAAPVASARTSSNSAHTPPRHSAPQARPPSPPVGQKEADTKPSGDDLVLASMIDQLTRMGAKLDDFRAAKGCLWVRKDDTDPMFNRLLQGWQFKYAEGKGWWRK